MADNNKTSKVKGKKEQFAILGIKTQFGGVLFETEIDKERFKQLKIGTPFKLTLLKDDRNLKLSLSTKVMKTLNLKKN